MDEIMAALLDKGLPFAMLGVAIWHMDKQCKKKDKEIQELLDEKDDLHKELREFMVRSSDKAHETITNNTVTISAFKEALLKNA